MCDLTESEARFDFADTWRSICDRRSELGPARRGSARTYSFGTPLRHDLRVPAPYAVKGVPATLSTKPLRGASHSGLQTQAISWAADLSTNQLFMG
jgi:hypothetical protein